MKRLMITYELEPRKLMGPDLPKIIFFGTFEYAAHSLKALIEAGYLITAVITNPDSTRGRKKERTPTPVKLVAQAAGLPVLQPTTLKSGKSAIYPLENSRAMSRGSRVGDIADLPDLAIVVAYSKIIPKEILEIFPKGVLNIHPSLLPAYRGPSPAQTAILNGEKETGVTIMQIDEEVDHGPILAQAKYQISPDAYCPQVTHELFELGTELLIQTIPDHLSGKANLKPQDDSLATFSKKFSWSDGRIDWQQPAEKIYNQIRALNPEPGAWTTWKRGFQVKILKILKAYPPTSRLSLESLKRFNLELPIIPQEVQLEGKRPIPFEDFLHGIGQKDLHFE